MLTSPVNVTIAAASGAGLNANTAPSDSQVRREGPAVPIQQNQPVAMVIEPELPSNSPINHVDAVAATVGARTVLQELALNIGLMLRIPRKPDETLTALFLRIIATIEAMPQAERLALEMRAGLKPLKITLTDLIMALKKPDGPEAARLTAMAEAPAVVPARSAANAATTTYIEQGTRSGQTEETLAMRAAARNSAAGQSVFSAESKIRAEAPPTDAKALQSQLKVLFEPGGAARAVSPERLPAPATAIGVTSGQATRDEAKPSIASRTDGRHETISISSANLKLDLPTVEKIRTMAQAIANQTADADRTNSAQAVADKPETGERRVQTLLTLKGLAEAVTAIPAKAVELLAVVVAEAQAPLPDQPDGADPVATARPAQAIEETVLPELAAPDDTPVAISEANLLAPSESPAESQIAGVPPGRVFEEQAEAKAAAELREAVTAERPQAGRTDLAQHAIPFAYAPMQPAREEMVAEAEDETSRGDEAPEDESGEDEGERRRPRDEYDEIHDAAPDDEPTIVINRDSTESDRAFALYQRMGGF